MTAPKWVTRQQVEFIHEAVIEMAGGAQGLRDVALARPQNQYAYGETETFQAPSPGTAAKRPGRRTSARTGVRIVSVSPGLGGLAVR